jgi:endonuclease-3 related protein
VHLPLNITKRVQPRRSILTHRCEFANTCTPEQGLPCWDGASFLTLLRPHRYLAEEMSASRILPAAPPFRNMSRGALRKPHAPPRVPPRPELTSYFAAMLAAYGPQFWWPGRTRFEVIVGAILTQNTSWTNVERAIANLRRQRLLSFPAMERVHVRRLASLIRSSGYFRQKALKLKAFAHFLRANYQGSLHRLFATPTAQLREQLLAVHGIGPETADSILLYAGHHPVFVVDAYTRRILQRHNLAHGKESYDDIRQLFEFNLPADAKLFNEYHALIVHTGKHFCRKRNPDCTRCPLQKYLPIVPDANP